MIKLKELLEEIENNKYTIYCDLDGVLVDFDKGYKDLTGKLPNEVNDDIELLQKMINYLIKHKETC